MTQSQILHSIIPAAKCSFRGIVSAMRISSNSGLSRFSTCHKELRDQYGVAL